MTLAPERISMEEHNTSLLREQGVFEHLGVYNYDDWVRWTKTDTRLHIDGQAYVPAMGAGLISVAVRGREPAARRYQQVTLTSTHRDGGLGEFYTGAAEAYVYDWLGEGEASVAQAVLVNLGELRRSGLKPDVKDKLQGSGQRFNGWNLSTLRAERLILGEYSE